MEGLCTNCPNKPLCSALCPEAELYVKQDTKSQRELTIGTPRYGNWPEPKEKALFTKMESKIIAYLLDGKSKKEIVEVLGITRHSLKLHIQNIRKKRLQIKPPLKE